MTSDTTRGEGGLDWPAGWDRTPAERREGTGKFDVGLRDTVEDLERELEDRIGVDEWRLSTAAEHQERNPRYPYADASPGDPGAVVRWRMDGESFGAACDRYTTLRDNLRALYLWLREKRKMEDRPVATGRSEFATARLPAGDDRGATGPVDEGDRQATGAGGEDQQAGGGDPATTDSGGPGLSDREAADLLGLADPDVSDRVVRISYEEAVKHEHPDQGGDGNIDRLQRARDRLLDG